MVVYDGNFRYTYVDGCVSEVMHDSQKDKILHEIFQILQSWSKVRIVDFCWA